MSGSESMTARSTVLSLSARSSCATSDTPMLEGHPTSVCGRVPRAGWGGGWRRGVLRRAATTKHAQAAVVDWDGVWGALHGWAAGPQEACLQLHGGGSQEGGMRGASLTLVAMARMSVDLPLPLRPIRP